MHYFWQATLGVDLIRSNCWVAGPCVYGYGSNTNTTPVGKWSMEPQRELEWGCWPREKVNSIVLNHKWWWGTNSMALDNIRVPNPWWVCPSDCGFHLIVSVFFPECVARVPVSLWGSGGWVCVRSMLRLWSQPSATPYGRAYGKFCRRGASCRFQTCRNLR